jgi:hypothetical protein
MNNTFSAEELADLVGMVDAQLVEVRSQPRVVGKTAIGAIPVLFAILRGSP